VKNGVNGANEVNGAIATQVVKSSCSQ